MQILKRLPLDGFFWFVKWIDSFLWPDPNSDSQDTSVLVMFQRLPVESIEQLYSLSELERRKILSGHGEYIYVKIFVGTTPLYSIGSIFKDELLISQFPTERYTLTLPHGDKSCEKHAVILKSMRDPQTYTPSYLRSKEYSGLETAFLGTRYQTHFEKGKTFILPAMELTRVYYAPYTEAARVFLQGHWREAFERQLILLVDKASGLQSEIKADGWHFLLRHNVPIEYRLHTAIFEFSPYARAKADQMHINALNDNVTYREFARKRKIPDHVATWFASGEIPFEYTTNPLVLECDGIPLGGINGTERILITCIHKSNLPNEQPDLHWTKENDQTQGDELLKTNEKKPIPNTPSSKLSTGKPISNVKDASANSSSTLYNGTSFAWINPPKSFKLKNRKSSTHDGPCLPSIPSPETDEMSTGARSHRKGLLNIAEARMPMQEESKRFSNLIKGLAALEKEGFLIRQIYPPRKPSLLEPRGGVACWNFITQYMKGELSAKHNSWRRYDGYFKQNFFITSLTPRAALIIRLTIGSVIGYWIEIENRKSETGLASIFIFGLPPLIDLPEFLEECLEQLTTNDARNPDKLLSSDTMKSIYCPFWSAVAYHHTKHTGNQPAAHATAEIQEREENKAIADSLRNFFVKHLHTLGIT